MKQRGPLLPLESSWEQWVLGGGASASFVDPSLPLHVEIGPGDDDHLMEAARADADANWLGIEYSRKRVQRQVRKIQREWGEPGNLRLIWRPAADLVGRFLSPAQVRAYHIYFPDPWPKAHHARFRLMDPVFLRSLVASLEPEGTISLATDSQEYAEAIAEDFREVPELVSLLEAPHYVRREPGPHITAFEARWREAGRDILALEYRRA